ncbi:Beta-1,4-galactosyltransferase 4,Beta-1,4-N-acetylgalactosaminyltransferase bre-4,Beta-1,4-galactosyltransferase 2,Beta-1,4-galactosyltransferase 5,Beta-1,4-galactosyltransferase 1,Beta-1,4-galactosyltransferase 3,Beta-1,4-galactosyltransferase 6 [Mytilus edulis]|uniref:Beta-1,4-galactosyltransferase n=1 Tax=Mytilus edulis TaxID=6550 RepID=A0A8S3PVC0_MYTED|nr:Beta-1,4-galactosyltransferase 4,Beta-1,4-N-acetylgalactosaminyltransferase bre-4,Beta-1,4-galactosyltransferase 2,Beta-1,4-galactosyltransferase 5,Beta-1,4-galactosyltransferase 1,Beta-1,4-galactosyltransferase 3,Beta-1,4-galactosyltransferase 6 [Mytilus edulis]
MPSPTGHVGYYGNNKNCTDIRDTTSCFSSCPETSPNLVGRNTPHLFIPSTTQLKTALSWVKKGGRYSPDDCIPRHHVAVIVPFRDRDQHLKTFLYNIHPFLRRQQLDYGIYIIDQIGTSKFNRAMLMNIGYAESIKNHKYTCFVFHDVDLLPEDDRNSYTCTTQPRHLSAAIDKFRYRLPYKAIFGGASALSKSQLQSVNGFSNKFFGWGGEDDDMWNRLMHANFTVTRHSNKVARYTMLRHGKEKGNKHNTKRYKLLEDGYKRFKTDGLNSLTYNVVRIQIHHLYTRISVDINENEVMKSIDTTKLTKALQHCVEYYYHFIVRQNNTKF